MRRPYTFDNDGNRVLGTRMNLAALPVDAVKFNSPGAPQSSLIMLSGKYVDPDGIVYDADGNVNESATAAWAREVATYGYVAPDYVSPREVKQESIQENSERDALAAWWDSMLDNTVTTAQEIPQRAVDVVTTGARAGYSLMQLLVIGAVAFAVIEVAGIAKGEGGIKRRARRFAARKAREYGRRATHAISRRIAGAR